MAYVLIQLLISLILFWHGIDGIVINCTVYPAMLQQVPKRIVGTFAIANMSNVELYWDHVFFEQNVQFPLKFKVVITNYVIISDTYVVQLNLYEMPREIYDLPLWSADVITPLQRNIFPNFVNFVAHSDRQPSGPYIMGIILNAALFSVSLLDSELIVTAGSMNTIRLNIHQASFPILFMLTDIQTSQNNKSTMVSLLIKTKSTYKTYQARQSIDLYVGNPCNTMVFKIAEDSSMHLTVTMTAHVLTSVSLVALAAEYQIYSGTTLLFKKNELIGQMEFPFIIPTTLIPITTAANYSIVATIFGQLPGLSKGETLFQGETYARLVPGTNNSVRISMEYTGIHIGTTIMGVVRQSPLNESTWPLTNTNLVFSIADITSTLDESYQFILFDQVFPIQFTLLNVNAINQSYDNVAFTITISWTDGSAIWSEIIENNGIIKDSLTRVDFDVTLAIDSKCKGLHMTSCYPPPSNMSNLCCSQFKCASDHICKLP